MTYSEGLWMNWCTLTGITFGDVVPETAISQLVASLIALYGFLSWAIIFGGAYHVACGASMHAQKILRIVMIIYIIELLCVVLPSAKNFENSEDPAPTYGEAVFTVLSNYHARCYGAPLAATEKDDQASFGIVAFFGYTCHLILAATLVHTTP